AIGFEGPNFHFTEALAAELRLAAEGLLRNQRVGTDGTRVDFVVNEVRQLEHVDIADGDGLVELVAGHAVEEIDLAGVREARNFQQVADFGFARAVEYGRSEGNAVAEPLGVVEQFLIGHLGERLPDGGVAENFAEPAAERFGLDFLAEQALETVAKFLGSPAQVRFENLADVHAGRNAERVEHDFDGRAIGKVRHIFLRHDAGDDALVAVTAGHLVADGELALHGDIDFGQLDDARRQFVTLLEFFLALLGDLAKDVDLPRGHLLDFFNLFDQERIFFVELQTLEVARFVGEVLFKFEDLRGFDGLVALVLLATLAGEDLDVHDGAFDAGRAIE